MNIFVGNLSPDVTEQELRLEFSAFGEVTSVIVMSDKYTARGQASGYGFVEMTSKAQGAVAIAGLKGKLLKGIPIDIVEALPLSDKKALSGGRKDRVSGGAGRRGRS